MTKKRGGVGGVVMVAAVNGVVWVPWIVVVALAVLVSLLVSSPRSRSATGARASRPVGASPWSGR